MCGRSGLATFQLRNYMPVRCLVLARARRRVYIVPLQSSLLQELCRWGTKSKAFDREAHRSVCIQLRVFASVLPAYVHQATGTTVVIKALKSIYHVTESTTRLVNQLLENCANISIANHLLYPQEVLMGRLPPFKLQCT